MSTIADWSTFQQLNAGKDEVEELLMGLILEQRVKGRIDQVNSLLELDSLWVSRLVHSHGTRFNIARLRQTLEKRRYNALEKWTEGLENMQNQIFSRLASPGDRSFSEFA